MGLSFWQIALVAVLVLLLFGRGKIPQMMGDLAEGIKNFRKGITDSTDETKTANTSKPLDSSEKG
jgi:sec-independent protein translocase protein TatA